MIYDVLRNVNKSVTVGKVLCIFETAKIDVGVSLAMAVFIG